MQQPHKYTVSGAGTAPETAYFLVFPLDDRRYAVGLESVERVLRAFAPAPLPKGPASVSGLLDLHGKVMPLLDLRHIFGLREKELTPRDYFIITSGPAGGRALPADSAPVLAGCRRDELLPAGAGVGGKYVQRVIKARDGLILVFDPARLPPNEEPERAGAPGGQP
ncbi:MAG: chemotaxis protein CheW [Elusimicrobia bacterium]|nr:chemotaxis protein CheW [Elusimicrobiota bacterium]